MPPKANIQIHLNKNNQLPFEITVRCTPFESNKKNQKSKELMQVSKEVIKRLIDVRFPLDVGMSLFLGHRAFMQCSIFDSPLICDFRNWIVEFSSMTAVRFPLFANLFLLPYYHIWLTCLTCMVSHTVLCLQVQGFSLDTCSLITRRALDHFRQSESLNSTVHKTHQQYTKHANHQQHSSSTSTSSPEQR